MSRWLQLRQRFAEWMDPENPASPLLHVDDDVRALALPFVVWDFSPMRGWVLPDSVARQCRERDLAARMREAQVFDFGSYRCDQSTARRAYVCDLYASGVLDLPYASCHFRIDGMVLVLDRVNISGRRGARMNVYGPTEVEGKCGFHMAHLGISVIDFENQRGVCGQQLPSIHSLTLEAVTPVPQGQELWREYIDGALAAFLDCSMVLATRGIVREIIPAPKFTNEQRMRKGKPRLPTITRIDFRAYEAARANEQHGTHASPVPHLRRGHKRNLADGRMVWVRDCIVNGSEEMMHARERYQVNATAAQVQ